VTRVDDDWVPCHFTEVHPAHPWWPAVPDPDSERVLHLGLAEVTCPGIPSEENLCPCSTPGYSHRKDLHG
jgi:hypothetical protein